MNFRCTDRRICPIPLHLSGFVILCSLAQGTKPSMRFLFVGSHFCTQASFRHPLTGLPLPSASGYSYPKRLSGTPTGDFHPISSRPCRAYTKEEDEKQKWMGGRRREEDPRHVQTADPPTLSERR